MIQHKDNIIGKVANVGGWMLILGQILGGPEVGGVKRNIFLIPNPDF